MPERISPHITPSFPRMIPCLSRVDPVQIICIIMPFLRACRRILIMKLITQKSMFFYSGEYAVICLGRDSETKTAAKLWEAGIYVTGNVGVHVLKNTFSSALSGKRQGRCHGK